jgi:large repetitive protein
MSTRPRRRRRVAAAPLLAAVLAAACGSVDPELPDGPPAADARPADAAGVDGDASAPDTTITQAPPELDNSTTTELQFTSDEDGATFECIVDGGAGVPCTSPFEVGPLADGEHTFEVAASDAAGNQDPTPATHTWTIDSSTPDTAILTGPGAASGAAVASTDASFTFTSKDAGPGATYECALDGAAFAACTSPEAYAGLAEGAHTFAVRVRDSAGNPDPTPATWTWTVDVTAPDTAITLAPPSPTGATTAAFAFGSDESPVTFECRLDGGAFAPCTTPLDLSGLGGGSHTFRVRATDAAGNTDGSPALHTWTIDVTPPDTAITSAPSTPTNATTASFQFTATEAGSTFQCALDGGAFTACTSPHGYTGLAAGAHTFAVRATDGVGNTDPTPAMAAWTIDLTAPDTTITAMPADPTSATTATFQFTATEAPATFECALDAGGFAACTSPRSYSGLATGAHTFRVRATDAAGNTDASPAQYAWDVDATPPTVTNVTSSNANGLYGATDVIAITVAFSEPVTVTGTPTLALETGAVDRTASYTGGSGTATLAFQYTVAAGDVSGDLDYRSAASLAGTIADAVGNPATLTLATPGAAGSLGANKALVIDGVAPVVTITAPNAASTVGPHVTYTFTVDDGSAAMCRIDSGPLTACTSNFQNNLPAGAHTFFVTATDAAGNTGTDTNTFTVACAAPTGGPSGVGLFHFSETAGQVLENSAITTMDAVMGTDNTVEPEDPVRTTLGRFGSGLDFNQVSRDTVWWLTGAAAPLAFHDHTVEMWFRPQADAISAGGGNLFVSDDNNMRLGYTTTPTTVTFTYRLTNATGLTVTLSAAPVAMDEWHHVVGTYSGTTMRLYVDGVAMTGTQTISGNIILGGFVEWGTSNNHIDGVMDEVFFGTAAMTTTQVLDRYCPL